MDIKVRKLNLIQWLVNVDNLGVINHLESFKKEIEQSTGWSDNLSTKQQKSVEISLEQIKSGKYISHEEAMNGIRKQYKL